MKTILLALGLAGSAALVATATADWPWYHGPNGDRTTEESVAKSGWKKMWETDTPLGFSSFSVADGKAYTIVQREVDGNPMEVCVALDAGSGDEVWAQPLWIAKYDGGGNSGANDNKGGDGPRSTPTVDDGRVYVIDASFRVYCFDGASGDPVWTVNVEKEYDTPELKWQNAASPLIDGGHLYLAGGGRGKALLAFDKKDGSLAWKAENDKPTHATPIAAELHGTRQIIFFTQEGLVAVTPDEGEELWRYDFPFKTSTAASPVVWEDIVFCSAGYGVGAGAVKITKDGDDFEAEEIWRTEGDNMNHWSTSVVQDGYLYGMFSFKKYGEGPLACVDIRTGEQKWAEDGFGPGNVILTGAGLLALSDAGELVLAEAAPEGYRELARKDYLDGKCWSSPVLAGGRVYARSTEEGVCVDVSDGLVGR